MPAATTTTYRSTYAKLQSWVDEVAALTKPADIYWCEGSPEEWVSITDKLVEAGTFKRLNEEKKPNSCPLYTSDAADDLPCLDLVGRRILKNNT